MDEKVLIHLDFWTQFRRYLEENNIHIQLSKPGKNASSNVVLRRSYFRMRPRHFLKYDQVDISVQFDGPRASAHYELVAQQCRRERPSGVQEYIAHESAHEQK
jgi:hypothetical protein